MRPQLPQREECDIIKGGGAGGVLGDGVVYLVLCLGGGGAGGLEERSARSRMAILIGGGAETPPTPHSDRTTMPGVQLGGRNIQSSATRAVIWIATIP